MKSTGTEETAGSRNALVAWTWTLQSHQGVLRNEASLTLLRETKPFLPSARQAAFRVSGGVVGREVSAISFAMLLLFATLNTVNTISTVADLDDPSTVG